MRVDGAEAQHLGFGAAGGCAVEARAVLAQGRVVVVPEFACARVAAKEDFGLALRPLDGAPEARAMADSSCGSTLPPSGRHWVRCDDGPKAAVGETVVGFGAVERLGELALGDVTDEAEVASAGLHEAVTVEHAQGSAIPGAAQQRRELGAAAAHGVQHGGEFLGEHEQAAIACLLAHNADEAAGGETRAGDTILGPGGIHFGEEAGDLVPTGSLARLAGFSDKHEEEVQGVTGGADHAVWSGADDVAKGGEQLQENGFGLGLGVRGQGAHGLPGEAIERVLLEYGLQGVLGAGACCWGRGGCGGGPGVGLGWAARRLAAKPGQGQPDWLRAGRGGLPG